MAEGGAVLDRGPVVLDRGPVLLWCEALAAVEAARLVLGELLQDLPPVARLALGDRAGRLMISLDAVAEVVGLLVQFARDSAACGVPAAAGQGVPDGCAE